MVGPVVARIGERRAVLMGTLLGAIGFTWYALAPTGPIYLLAAPVFPATGFIMPGLQGLMTRRVTPHEQGQLQGANQSLMGIGSIIGPPLFGEVFAWSIRNDATLHTPGLAIFLAAGLLGLGFWLALFAAKVAEKPPTSRAVTA